MKISKLIKRLQDIPVCVSQYISMYYGEPETEIRECHFLKNGILDVVDFDLSKEEGNLTDEDVMEWNKNILWIGE